MKAKKIRAWMVGWNFGKTNTGFFTKKEDAEAVARRYARPPKVVEVEIQIVLRDSR